jgi:transketolase
METAPKNTTETNELLKKIANRLRILSIESTTAAGSGHPTSCCSAADLLAVLFFNKMNFDVDHPKSNHHDKFVLSKGHAAPLLYATWAMLGKIPFKELKNLRKIDSRLEGHPTSRLDFVDVATGSLGQGLSAGLGMAIHADIHNYDMNIYVLLGDGELMEGSNWEAASLAGIRHTSRLVLIADLNQQGQSQNVPFQDEAETYQKRFSAFGWDTQIIDGHDIEQISLALEQAGQGTRPLAILARTIKGKGIPDIENKPHWHGKVLSPEEAQKVVSILTPQSVPAVSIAHHPISQSTDSSPLNASKIEQRPVEPPHYKTGEPVATRKAFGNALLEIGFANPSVITLDGDVENSTYTELFAKQFPDRFIECFIAEQNMIGIATGLSAMGNIPVCSTFAAFFSRALDQIRMSAISESNLKLVGTHAGCSIGEDGASQMGLEDLAYMRALPKSIVLAPCDATSTEKLLEQMIHHEGIAYLRTLRTETPVIYSPQESFKIGDAKLLRSSSQDQAIIIACGITVFEALRAYEDLEKIGIKVAVVDAYSIKPFATQLISPLLKKVDGKVLTVEDHYPEGGLGDTVAGELSQYGAKVEKLAIQEIPHSGKKSELLAKYGIDSKSIVSRIQTMLNRQANHPSNHPAKEKSKSPSAA